MRELHHYLHWSVDTYSMLVCVCGVFEWLNVLVHVRCGIFNHLCQCTHACYSNRTNKKKAERKNLIINLFWMKYSVPFLTKIKSLYLHLYNGSMHSCIFTRKHQFKNLLPFIFHQRLPWQELLWAFLTHFCGSQSLRGRRWFPLISYKTSVNKHNKRTNKNSHPMSWAEKQKHTGFSFIAFYNTFPYRWLYKSASNKRAEWSKLCFSHLVMHCCCFVLLFYL